MSYTPSKRESFWTAAARYWWSEELTEQQRLDFMIASLPLVRRIQSAGQRIGEVSIAELWFKLYLFLDKHEEGIK